MDVNTARKTVYAEIKAVWDKATQGNAPIVFPNQKVNKIVAPMFCTVKLGAVVPQRIALNAPDVKNQASVEINIYGQEGIGEGATDDIVNAFVEQFSDGYKKNGVRFIDNIMSQNAGADNGYNRNVVIIQFYWLDDPTQ